MADYIVFVVLLFVVAAVAVYVFYKEMTREQ